ncbi:MAG: hypothetical protein U5L45_14110 [Saprospiraceae bacterium]|nr:hypothetical protein [Saprospiraceae bacterium]
MLKKKRKCSLFLEKRKGSPACYLAPPQLRLRRKTNHVPPSRAKRARD